MPLYEYLCKACKHQFERIQKFSDPLVRTCPVCGKDEVEQMLSAPAVQFKGSGWYVTDYARKSGGGSTSASSDGSKIEGKSDSKSESKSESKSDSKPASKED